MKVFRDPVHGVIDLDTGERDVNDLILKLIDSREFQRLHYIKQLGFVYFAYPSAMHTRFEHSIGVACLAKRFVEKLISIEERVLSTRPKSEHGLLCDFFEEIKSNRCMVIVASLLHDIGHGPLSHVFEEITGIRHESWTENIIMGNTEINSLLSAFDTSYPSKICRLLTSPVKSSPMTQIIAWQLDIDRIDYLLRDSYMSGSGYGRFDVEWLFNVLTVGISDGKAMIGLDLGKGLSVAEDFIMARAYMFKNVYLHKTALVGYDMLRLLLKRIKNTENPSAFFQNESLRNLALPEYRTENVSKRLADYLSVSDVDLYHFLGVLRGSDDEVISRLAGGLLDRRLFKRIDDSRWDEVKAAISNEKGTDAAPYYMSKLVTKTEKASYRPKQDEILLFGKNGECFSLHEISDVIKSQMKPEAAQTESYADWG